MSDAEQSQRDLFETYLVFGLAGHTWLPEEARTKITETALRAFDRATRDAKETGRLSETEAKFIEALKARVVGEDAIEEDVSDVAEACGLSFVAKGMLSDDRGEYGIVATVTETDQVFRKGAKAWIAGGTGGEGWDKFVWIALSRSRRVVEKWAPTFRFSHFRAKWVPEHLRSRVWYVRGTREEMEAMASDLEAFAAKERATHPNRGWKPAAK